MNDVYLTRVEPAKNMARYYVMSLQPNLFGEWSLVREWGRIGRGGQVRAHPYTDFTAAMRAMETLTSKKTSRGYFATKGRT